MDRKIDLEDLESSVLYVKLEGSKALFSSTTFIVSDLMALIKASLRHNVTPDEREALFDKGVDCRLLKPGADWQQGKLKISVEFVPDEIDSPLDDIRQAIADDSQPV